jgi:hypothetical protein
LDFQLGQSKDQNLTKEAIAVLHRQLGDKPTVEYSNVQDKWYALCLSSFDLDAVMKIGSFAEEFEWIKFLAIICTHISKDIGGALKVLCEILTKDLDGGQSRIDFETFRLLYKYLAVVDGDITIRHVNEVLEHLSYDVERQNGMISPQNFLSDSCPSLSVEE